MSKVIAVDLGGTYLRVALVQNSKILKYIKKPTPKEKNAILRELFNIISSLMTKDVKRIGIGAPGLLKNCRLYTPNLPLKNINLKKAVGKRFNKRVEIENDANCVALAESKLGCKKKIFIVLTLGTGIGGGIIINGKLYKGKGNAGEFGHMILNYGEQFEKLCAWKKIKKTTIKEFGREVLVKELIKVNNPKAKKILNEISMYLGQGIANLIGILDPEIVVLAGGMREGGPKLLSMIKKNVNKYCFLPKTPPIIWTKLKHPGTMGASLLIE